MSRAQLCISLHPFLSFPRSNLNHTDDKTLLVTLHFCTSDSWGGLELYAATLMAELQKAGCRVIAICHPQSKVHEFLLAHGVECRTLPSRRKLSIASIRFVRQLLREEAVDTVHVHFHKDIWIPSIAMRNDSRKLFLSIYMGVISKNDPFHRWVYNRVDAIFTSSEELNIRLPSLYPVPKKKIYLLPYGRAIEKYAADSARRDDVRRTLGVGSAGLLIGTMVRIDPGKGVMDFAKSILYLEKNLLHGVTYLIIGEPTRKAHRNPDESPFERHCEEYLESIRKFISSEQLEAKIILIGYQSDLIGYLSAMDVFVFPSRDELYSLVVLDAMGMGLPVVAARAGGNMWQIEDGTRGLLYDVGNSRDLASKLTNYVNDANLRREHGAMARQFVEKHHSMKETVKQVLWFYQEFKSER